MHFASDLLYMAFKAVSSALFSTEAEVLTAANAIVAHISSCSVFITQFTLALLTAGPARRILCDVILYKIMSLSICIL
jgi:hypothetical protein